MFLLGVNPSDHLIQGIWIGSVSCVEFVGFDHGLADGFGSLLNFRDNGWIVKDSARDLAVPSAKAKNEMEGGFLLDIVIAQGAAIFELLSSKDQTLLIWRNALLVLDLGLYVLNGIRSLDIESDRLTGKSLYKNLEKEVEGENVMENKNCDNRHVCSNAVETSALRCAANVQEMLKQLVAVAVSVKTSLVVHHFRNIWREDC